jgi:hypothetical protein
MWHVWERNAYRILVGIPQGKKQPGRSKCKREHSMKMDPTEIRKEDLNWINLAHDGDMADYCEHNVPAGS